MKKLSRREVQQFPNSRAGALNYTLYCQETTLPPSGDKVIESRFPLIFCLSALLICFIALLQSTILYLLVYLLDYYSYPHRPYPQLGQGLWAFSWSQLNIQCLVECPAHDKHLINFSLMGEWTTHR